MCGPEKHRQLTPTAEYKSPSPFQTERASNAVVGLILRLFGCLQRTQTVIACKCFTVLT